MNPDIIAFLMLLLPVAFLALFLTMCKILNQPVPDFPAEYQQKVPVQYPKYFKWGC
jgi:hypothetical protein